MRGNRSVADVDRARQVFVVFEILAGLFQIPPISQTTVEGLAEREVVWRLALDFHFLLVM